MSVSLSSVYEQTESLKQIEDKLELASNENNLTRAVEDIVQQTGNLTMAENYRLMAILSKQLNSNSSVPKKFAALYTIKQLLLTASHYHYIFASVKALNIIANLIQFEGKKSEFERVKLYVRQLSLKGNGDDIVQERYCYRLLKFADQFLIWFATNIPTHINAQFVYRSTFARKLEQLKYKRDIKAYQFCKDSQFNKFQHNFNANRALNIENIKQLTDFISLEVRSVIEQRKLKSQLLCELVRTADSYCIKAIVSEICNIMQDSSRLFYCLKLTQSLMNIAEIQFIQLTKLYIVPTALRYVLPYSFSSGARLKSPQLNCSPSQEKYIIDCICKWKKMTQKVGLSYEFYKTLISEFEKQKRQLLIVQEKNLNQFLTNLIDLQGVNEDKKPNIKQPYTEKQLMAVFEDKGNDVDKFKQKLLNESAINSLDEFRQSKAEVVVSRQPKYVQQINQMQAIFVQSYNFNNNVNKNAISKQQNMETARRDTPNFVTLKDIPRPNHLNSPNKQTTNLEQKKGKQEQSSFMAFNASNFSHFSQYSVKKSKENQQKILPINNITKNQSLSSKNLRTSRPSQESGSIVYFGRSQDFRSQASINNEQKKLSSYILSQKASFHKQAQKLQEKQDIVSNYKFQESAISKSSSASSIHHYGINNSNYPQPASKPSFGFKKKNIEIFKSHESNASEKQNILPIEHEMKASKQQIRRSSIRDSKSRNSSLDSGIKDLSGGRHLFDKLIKSPFDQNQDSRLSKDISEGLQERMTNKFASTNNFKLTPQIQYYAQQSKKLGRNRGLHNNKQQKKATTTQHIQSKDRNFGEKHLLIMPHYAINHQQTNKSGNKKINIIDKFGNDKLLNLEKELGKAIEEKNIRELQFKKKQNQYKLLKSMSAPYMGKKMQNLKKENEIIKILAGQKNKQDYAANAEELIKPISSKNRITDYFLQNKIQSKFIPQVHPFDRAFTKQILGSRCLLITNQNLELGYNYSLRQNEISLYITFFKAFDTVKLAVIENSLILQKQVNLVLTDQPAGYQLKLKRKVKRIASLKKQQTFLAVPNQIRSSLYKFPVIKIAVSELAGEVKMQTQIPCSVFNLTEPIEINKQVIKALEQKKASRTEPLQLSKEFNKNYKQKIQKYFPHHMPLVEGWKLIGFRFPPAIFGSHEDQFYKIRIVNGKEIQIQCLGDNKSLLAQTLVCMLTR